MLFKLYAVLYIYLKNKHMKKLSSFIAFILIATISFAQVQRKASTANKADSASSTITDKKGRGGTKKEMLKDLNLTKDQKLKLKETRKLAKDKKTAIENDEKLSAAEKETKLNELKKEQAKNTMGILNEDQKEKIKKTRKEKRKKKNAEEEN